MSAPITQVSMAMDDQLQCINACIQDLRAGCETFVVSLLLVLLRLVLL